MIHYFGNPIRGAINQGEHGAASDAMISKG